MSCATFALRCEWALKVAILAVNSSLTHYLSRRPLSCRAGASDLPQIAALMGGIVAQEVIKLITKQYIPLEGTMIFNGIKSTTRVLTA